MSEKALNLAVVGLGGWGKNVVKSFGATRGARIHSICDPNSDRLQVTLDQFPGAVATSDFDKVLNDSSVDAIVLATPAELHYDMARAALLANKHVYVEKPLTLSSAHAEELLSISELRNLKLMVGHLLEYHPAIEFIKQQIDSGGLGDVRYIYTRRLNLGVVRSTENAFWSLAPHDVSIILYLLGEKPDSIAATGACYLQPGIEDVVFANLHFPSGRSAHIHVSWLDPHKAREVVVIGSERMLVFDDMEKQAKVRVYDKRAIVKGDLIGAPRCITVTSGETHVPELPNGDRAPLDIETQHFVDSILNNTIPRSDGQDGLRVVRILEEVDSLLRTERERGFVSA
jgi:predicted dehydrogenase